jgi:lysophospholipase L1-like esterase
MTAIVTIFGDSNAAGYRDTHGADSLEETIGKLDFCASAKTFACCGTTISPGEKNLADWIHITENRSTKNRRRIIRPADLSIVMIGTNDIFRQLDTPVEQLHEEMERLLRKTNTQPDRIHVIAPLCGDENRTRAAERIRGEVKKVAEKFGAHYVALYPEEKEWQKGPDGKPDKGHCGKDFFVRIGDHMWKVFEKVGKSDLAKESYIYVDKKKATTKAEPQAKRRKTG